MLVSTICGMHVLQADKKDKLRNIGRVRSFVFHPREKKVVGILVKRPDAALMFHRKDAFVRFGAFSLYEEGSGLLIENVPDATGLKAQRTLGINLDECVLWWGMPVQNEDGELLGYINNVSFSWKTGDVGNIEIGDGGAIKTALKGKTVIDAKDILGFRRTSAKAKACASASANVNADAGAGNKSTQEPKTGSEKTDPDEAWDAPEQTGCILVKNGAKSELSSEGLVQVAGKTTAKTKHKIQVASEKAKSKISEKTNITPDGASEAVNKASYAAGEKIGSQLGEAKGMFKNFKDEFQKAYNSED